MTAAPGNSQGSGKQGPEQGWAGHDSEMSFYVSNTTQEGTGPLSPYSYIFSILFFFFIPLTGMIFQGI